MGTGSPSLIAGTQNAVYGMNSAVLGGFGNIVCDDNAVIANGESNKIETKTDGGSFSFIGAGEYNEISGQESFIGAGDSNDVTSGDSAIAAGEGNRAEASDAFVGAGVQNEVLGSPESAVAGGEYNVIEAQNSAGMTPAGGAYGFIGGGYANVILGAQDGFAVYSTIAGGANNTITGNSSSAAGSYSAVAGGGNNAITASYASILGGRRNAARGQYAVVDGGFGNLAQGSYAVVLGGDANVASGTLSLAAGYHADAVNAGSFVWSDYSSGSTDLKDTAANQFVARASGGITFYSNEAMTAGVSVAPGSGTWSSLSDRNAKTDIVPIDEDAVLTKVAALPVSTWRYTSELGVRHLGPMAQDFYSAFGLGNDVRYITSIDEDGVALAAVKALNRELRRENGALRADAARDAVEKDAEIRALDLRVRRLDAALAAFVAHGGHG